jgi:tetratricopeptide (TPR) repeat protein
VLTATSARILPCRAHKLVEKLVEEYPAPYIFTILMAWCVCTQPQPSLCVNHQLLASPACDRSCRAHKLVEEYPSSALAWFGVGCYYMASRQYEQARRFFAKATQLDKHNAHAWIGFGHAFAEQVCVLAQCCCGSELAGRSERQAPHRIAGYWAAAVVTAGRTLRHCFCTSTFVH